MQQRKLRRKSRKNSLQVLYANDVAGVSVNAVMKGDATLPFLDELDDYACNLIKGTKEHVSEIDDMLGSVSKN